MAQVGEDSKATIHDVAERAGVSIATVSRVINGRPDVAPRTREAVLAAIRAQNFSTNRSARALSGGRTGLIGLTIPILHAEYFAHIMSGAAEALYEQDMRLVVCPTLHQHDREVTLLDRLMHGTTDGAILLLPEETNQELKALQRHGYPFVVIDAREQLDEGIPAVSSAHWAGAKVATDHLVDLGHRRVATITGPSTWTASRERVNGYRASLAARGILASPEYVQVGDFKTEAGEVAAHRLFNLPEPPTAVFAANDNMAVGVMQAARQRGLRVPEDISIVGFDDTEGSLIVTPALTTVRQPLEEMGRVGVSLLLRLLAGQRLEALRVDLATRLIVRDSTAPPRCP